MSVINKYLTGSISSFNGMIESNKLKLQQLHEENEALIKRSDEIKVEFANLENTNKFVEELLKEIDNLPKEGGEDVSTTET